MTCFSCGYYDHETLDNVKQINPDVMSQTKTLIFGTYHAIENKNTNRIKHDSYLWLQYSLNIVLFDNRQVLCQRLIVIYV
jgi:hypothetical protein